MNQLITTLQETKSPGDEEVRIPIICRCFSKEKLHVKMMSDEDKMGKIIKTHEHCTLQKSRVHPLVCTHHF